MRFLVYELTSPGYNQNKTGLLIHLLYTFRNSEFILKVLDADNKYILYYINYLILKS